MATKTIKIDDADVDMPGVGPTKKELSSPAIIQMVCCDCGLVHQIHIDIREGINLVITIFRDDWITGIIRQLKKHLFIERRKK